MNKHHLQNVQEMAEGEIPLESHGRNVGRMEMERDKELRNRLKELEETVKAITGKKSSSPASSANDTTRGTDSSN